MKKSFYFSLYFTTILISTTLAQTQKVRFGSVVPKDSPWELGINDYIKEVETKAGGTLKFKTYLGGQLGGEVEMIKGLAMGTLDAGAFSTAAVAEALDIPELQIFELPFLFNNNEEADYILDKIMFEPMAELLKKKGVMLIMWGTNGWRGFGSVNKPIKNPSDLKGLKMRSQEADVYIQFYKALGATPVPIATPDVLVSMKTGMVDGFDQTPIFSVSVGWINTVKYFTVSNHIYQPGIILVSKRFYDKLNEESKSACLIQGKRDEISVKSRNYVRNDNAEILKTVQNDFKVQLTYLDATQINEFKKAVQGVYKIMSSKINDDLMTRVINELKKYRINKEKVRR